MILIRFTLNLKDHEATQLIHISAQISLLLEMMHAADTEFQVINFLIFILKRIVFIM